MAERLLQNYTITFSGGSYTITYTSFPSETMVAVQTEFVLHSLGNYFYMRTGTSNTLLDYTKCTSPTGANRAALIAAIQALYNPNVFSSTLTISPATATDQFAVVNNGKVIFCSFPEPGATLCRLTFPTASDTMVGRATTDTLTNKSLTSPAMTGPRITGVASFSAASGEYEINVFTGDGNAYFDHGTAAKSVIFRSNNGATTQMTITDSATSVPRLNVTGTGIQLPTTGGTATLLDYYEETTLDSTFTGGTFTSGTLTLQIVRIGKLVFIRWPAIQGAATAAITNNTTIPTRFRPTAIQAFNCPGQVNSVVTPIQVSVGTSGTLTFAQSNGTGFSTGTNGPTLGGIAYCLN